MVRIVFALLFLALALPQAKADGDAGRGATAYAQACARCHAAVSRVVRRIEGSTPEQKADWLTAFLPRHHAPDEATYADLIAYLLSR